MSERNEEISIIGILKTTMMLLVVLYHSAALWSNGGWFNQPPVVNNSFLPILTEYLNNIHIYVFTFTSGYLFYYSNYIKKTECLVGEIVKKRFIRLIIPYIIVTIFWLVPFEIIYFDESPWQLFMRFVVGTAPRQLWFLLMLFGVNICFCLWIKTVKKALTLKYGLVFLYFINICGAMLIRLGIPNVLQILTVCRYLMYFYFGYVLCRNGTEIIKRINIVLLLIIHITVFVFTYYLNNICQYSFRKISIFLTPIVSITGIMLVYRLVEFVNKKEFQLNNSVKEMIGVFKRNELAVYFFHQQWIWIIISIMNKKAISPYLIVCVSFIISIIMSVLMSESLKRIPMLKKILSL